MVDGVDVYDWEKKLEIRDSILWISMENNTKVMKDRK